MRALLLSTPLAVRTRAWQSAGWALAGYVAWLVVWYRETLASMVSIWYRSDTFAHGFVVVPISLWLAWRRRHLLRELTPEPTWLPVPLLAALAGLWIAGELADVAAARMYAVVGMAIAGTWALLGTRVSRVIAFPLGYLLFAVPVGEFLLPGLMTYTADVTAAALRWTGVPVYREGQILQVPSGTWSVVEACSGLRYLIASVALGLLFAYLTYRSLRRRLLFIAASIAVPIVANWMRAYLIVMLGYLSGNRLAVGVDHLIYGWLFFGAVMLAMFWVGTRWHETARLEEQDAATAPSVAAVSWRTLGGVLAGAMFTVAIGGVTAGTLATSPAGAATLSLPAQIAGWQVDGGETIDWKPGFTAPRAQAAATYVRGDSRVGLRLSLYYQQDARSKLVSSANLLVRRDDDRWQVLEERAVRTASGLVVDQATLSAGNDRLLVRRWYWIDGRMTASEPLAKMLQAWSRLRGAGDTGAAIVVHAPYAGRSAAAVAALDAFMADAATPIAAMLARAAVGAEP